MKLLIKYTASLFLFWLCLFFVNRLFFVAYQYPIGARIKHKSDILKSFVEGYKLDIATSAILLGIPMLLALLFYVFKWQLFKKTNLYATTGLILLYNLSSLGDAGIYREWNAKLNLQALMHFNNPMEVWRTVSWDLLGLALFLFVLFTLPFQKFYQRKLYPMVKSHAENSQWKVYGLGILFLCISAGVIVVAIRGGITNMPINQSAAYFSNDVLANDMAVNPLYNILQDLTIKSNIPDSAQYKLRSNEEARAILKDEFLLPTDSSFSILTTKRPNLVYIFLESWSTDNVGVLGGVKGCTPNFDELSQEGLLFTQAYGQAYVSDQGIPAVLSAYPSVSRIAIINQPAKVPNLPCITDELKPEGYTASFMFGGDLVYGNLRGYLLEKHFTELIEDKDLSKYPSGKLGVHDEFTFVELLKALNIKRAPFLQGFFTTSTHMPYDFTPSDTWKSSKKDVEKKYTEATHYTDIHLGKFFEEAKKQPWYSNTLFIVVADHSHNSIKQWDAQSAMRQRIPMLFIGGALQEAWKGKTWNKIVSQLDVTATLLHQMDLPTSRYPWSRNIFQANTPSSAFYVFFGGIGYLNENGFVSSSLSNATRPNYQLKDTSMVSAMNDKATSFQQLIFEDVRLRK